MRAIVVSEPGDPTVLSWSHVPSPQPGPGEVIIDIAASAVNRADLLQRQGHYPPPPGATDILGLECSGTITALGAGVTSREIGEEVTALLAGGGYAEQVAVPVGQLMGAPAPVPLVDAASLPEVACTVWSNLVMTAHLQQGEWVLIHGGGSGIGTMAIQVARALGARIAVTAGSAEKLEACAALGADVLIDYRQEDFVEATAQATAGRGVDVILDNMGASYLDRNLSALAFGGRLAVIGLQGGIKAEVNLGAMLRGNATVSARSLRARPPAEKAAICTEVERNIWPWISAGLITTVIGARLPMNEAGDAHRLLESGAVTGKILLTAVG
jgi:putative PIG3 family NAD(P)H quinone oxidoreductase